MEKELQQQLINKFPLLYGVSPSIKREGITIGDGWFQLLWDLSNEIYPYVEKQLESPTGCLCGKDKGEHPIIGKCACFDPIHTTVMQVKSKFEGLRYYLNFGSEAIFSIIKRYEDIAWNVCQNCGSSPVEKFTPKNGWDLRGCVKCIHEMKLKRDK